MTATGEITYCANGCKTAAKLKARTNGPSRLCSKCEDRLHQWLTKIPDAYALLPGFIEPGTAEPNPGSKATKKAEVAAPIRLEVLDLLDNRHGRQWLGTAPAHDRRGVAGVLQSHVERLQEERPLTAEHDDRNVTAACALLDKHRFWLAEREWITDIYEDIQKLNREISDAIGEYRRPPVGRCHIDSDKGPCDGKLFATAYGGVHCVRCQATWDAGELRLLGMALAQAAEEVPA